MRRVVVDAVPSTSGDLQLGADAAHYVERVLRLREGDVVELLDGTGRTATARLAWRGGVAWAVDVSAPTDAPEEAELVVVAALIKASRWEWMIEKAAELGATRIVPVSAERSVVQIPAKKAAAKVERWARVAAAAARQSGRPRAPEIALPCPLAAALDATAGCAVVRLDFGGAAEALTTAAAGPVALVIGPEGGFTDAERSLLDARGAVVAALGPAVLRAETAALAALAAVRLHRAMA